MIKIGITLGDPCGISPEILLKSLKYLPKATYVIYGSKSILDKLSKQLDIPFEPLLIKTPLEIKKEGIYLINIYDRDFEVGKPSVESGKASILFLERATKDILNKNLDALVTLPISKEYTMKAGFKYAGHTDFLVESSKAKEYSMVLACNQLKVALITTHIPLKEVPKYITKQRIISKIELINKELTTKFEIKSPKIAVLGLNPHAGDGGNIGKEEIEIIQPACEVLRERGIYVTNPLSADTAFCRRKEFDIFVAMYHDQGLIPLKVLCFRKAVNITFGLPFIRTSPDHGTAFDIAGKGLADPSSFIESVKLAHSLILKAKNTSF
ncbi:MAG: 4-hydroxythreonine-4-phosphate dehydrogenase PdxA [Aquificae bacterium]|nr:4-hydroxythreonine-4-phosphate dehydrogenase PdxA [Aquificota bacterium]